MSRNYKKEAEWEKEKYELMRCKIEKDLGVSFKEYLKKQNMTFSAWLRGKINEEMSKN